MELRVRSKQTIGTPANAGNSNACVGDGELLNVELDQNKQYVRPPV